MAPPARLPAALRVLARRRAFLAPVAATALLLEVVLAVELGIVALAAQAAPAGWPVASVGAFVVLVVFLPLLALALGFLSAGMRALVLFLAGPTPSTPAGLAGAFGGLLVFLVGRRLRARRGVLGWLADPLGAAAGMAVQRALPPDHPLAALLEMAGMQPRRRPTRGAGWLALGLVLGGIVLWQLAALASPGLGWAVFACVVAGIPIVGALAAATKGILAGAWDRVVMDRVAADAQGAVDALTGLGAAFAGPRPG
jgi:hypothetical protein